MRSPEVQIEVIGCDAGGVDSLSLPHQVLLRQAEAIAAPERLLSVLKRWLPYPCPELVASDQPAKLISWLQERPHQRRVVIASGDPLWYGIGRRLLTAFNPYQLRFHPAPSSLQLAFARLGRPWQDASWISLHGRDSTALAKVLQQRPSALVVLTDPSSGGAIEVHSILLSSGLASAYAFWICENLGHPQERVRCFKAADPLPNNLYPLHLVVLVAQDPELPDPDALPLFGLDDGLYQQHPDRPGLMTKREIRIQLLAELSLPRQGVLWDLGAGTGSIGLEALRLRPQLKLVAVEHRGGSSAVIQSNAKRLGVWPITVIEQDVLTVLQSGVLNTKLAKPDRVILSGGGKKRSVILEEVLAVLAPDGIVVIPLATLEAMVELRSLLEQAGLQVKISQQQTWRGQPLADGTRLAPTNPVLILRARRT